MARTLAEQLAALAEREDEKVVSPKSVLGDNNLESLVRRFEGKNGCARSSFSGVMPQDVQIGDKYLIRMTEKDGIKATSLNRPVIIWGIYRDKSDYVRAVDVIRCSTNVDINAYYPWNLLIRTPEEMQLAKVDKIQRINMQDVYTLPWKSVGEKGDFFDHAGCIGSISKRILPHLVIRRMNSLLHNTENKAIKRADIHATFIYEGLFLPGLSVVSGAKPPEIDCRCARKNDTEFGGVSQDLVRGLMNYEANKRLSDEQLNHKYNFPAARYSFQTWPHWKEWSARPPEPMAMNVTAPSPAA